MASAKDTSPAWLLVVCTSFYILFAFGYAQEDYSKNRNVIYVEQAHDSYHRLSNNENNDILQQDDLDEHSTPDPTDKYTKEVKDSLQQGDLDGYTTPGPTDKYNKKVNDSLQQDDMDGYTTPGPTDKYNKEVNDSLQQDDMDGYTTPGPTDKYNKEVKDSVQQDDLDGYTTPDPSNGYHEDIDNFKTDDLVNDEWGNGTNCGPPSSKLMFKWSPIVLDPQGYLKLEFKLVTLCVLDVCGITKGDHSKDRNVLYMEQAHDPHERMSKFDQNNDNIKHDDLDGYTTPSSTDKYNKEVKDSFHQDDLDGYTTPGPTDKYNKEVEDSLQQDDLDGYTTVGPTDKYNKDVNDFDTDDFGDEEWGNGTNCGPPSSKLMFKWSPVIIDPQGSVTFKFKFVAPSKFDYGILTLDVGVRGQGKPIFTVSMDLSCEKDLKKAWNPIQCPIQKGTPTPVLKYDETNLTRLPTGAFNITMKITNEDQELFLCLNLDAELKPEN